MLESGPSKQALEHPLGEVLGEGASSRIHAYGPGRVVKVFRTDHPRDSIRTEFQNTQAVHQAGLPVPMAYETLRIADSDGIVFQRMLGRPLDQHLMDHPWALEAEAARFAKLQHQLHQHRLPVLPWQLGMYLQRLQLSQAMPGGVQRKVLARLSALPVREAVCHGDFVPPNVLIHEGEFTVVDWAGATCGDPVACIVETYLRLARRTETASESFLAGAECFRSAYIESCRRLNPELDLDAAFALWLPVVAGAQLTDAGTVGEQEQLLETVMTALG